MVQQFREHIASLLKAICSLSSVLSTHSRQLRINEIPPLGRSDSHKLDWHLHCHVYNQTQAHTYTQLKYNKDKSLKSRGSLVIKGFLVYHYFPVLGNHLPFSLINITLRSSAQSLIRTKKIQNNNRLQIFVRNKHYQLISLDTASSLQIKLFGKLQEAIECWRKETVFFRGVGSDSLPILQ